MLTFDNKTQTLLGILIVAVIAVGFIVYAFPPQASAKTLTVTDTQTATVLTSGQPTTVIKEDTTTQTIALPSTVTALVTKIMNRTITLSTVVSTVLQTQTQTVTQEQPKLVTIWGNVTAPAPLTTVTEIDFSSGNTVFKAAVKGGTYTIPLPNAAEYTVTLIYSINPIGSGSCTVHTPLPLNTMLLMWNLNWQC